MEATIKPEIKEYNDALHLVHNMKNGELDDRVRHIVREIRTLQLPLANKALKLLIEEMNATKGFARHDGKDYFVHPIAIAQTALDNGFREDVLIASCLLHDILEDVPHINFDVLVGEFGEEVATIVDNVSKRDGEPFAEYIERFSSDRTSALVKILDRLNNVSTLSESTTEHREKQLKETRDIYIPLTKAFRRMYWDEGEFYFQARTIMTAILNEVERGVKAEKLCTSLAFEMGKKEMKVGVDNEY